MDGKDLLLAMGGIDSTLIAEAAQKKTFRHRTRRSAQWIALAAGLTVVIAAAVSLPALLRPPVEQEPESGIVPAAEGTSVSNESSVAESTEADLLAGAAPQDSESSAPIRINRSDIHLNGSEGVGAMFYHPPELYDEIRWDDDDITRYFGRDLTPAYRPEGIASPSGNGSATIYRQKSDGVIAYDTVSEVYGQTNVEYTDSGEVILPEGFMITASRLGIMTDCIYVLPGEDEIRTSEIAGTVVTVGYREMPYGPYNPETHAPSGSYPLYVFQFAFDGVDYDITTHNLPLDEGVKIAASFITGSAEIEIIG